MQITTPNSHNLPIDYSGRILTGDYSQNLQRELKKQISACFSYEQTNLPIILYIAAWHTNKKGIWYEYVSQSFLNLFNSDTEHIAATFNNAIIDRREYNQQEDIFHDIRELTLKSDEISIQRDHLRKKGAQTGIVEAVYKVSMSDDKKIWLKDWASVTNWQEDSICLSPGYLTDISKEMSQKDQIDELNAVVNRDKNLLVEAERNAALGQISAQVFHEIRNPVASIGGLAKRLMEKASPADPRIYVEVIAKEAERLEKILNNLFQYTKQIDLDLQQIDPTQMVKRVIGLVRSDLDACDIHVSLKTSGVIEEIQADRNQLQMALVQIIKNSIEAMHEGGKLEIRIEIDGDFLFFFIRDTGIGIRPTHQKKVTEPFFTTKVYGTGLGLSLAEKAIKLHNGNLEINRLKSGITESIIQLPIIQTQEVER